MRRASSVPNRSARTSAPRVADVADRQAGQEPVERPRLARLQGGDEVLRPTSCPSAPGRPASPRRAGRGRPGSRTSPVSTSWSISFSPRPSTSIASRWANQRIGSLSCSGQAAGGWSSGSRPRPARARPGRRSSGRSSGKTKGTSEPSRASTSTRTTCGMISPAFWITTVSPTRTSLRAISSALCRVARLTVVPGEGDGRQVGHGRQLAGLADLDADVRGPSSPPARPRTCTRSPSAGSCSGCPAASRWPRSSTLMTRPSVWKSSVFRRSPSARRGRSPRRSSRRRRCAG